MPLPPEFRRYIADFSKQTSVVSVRLSLARAFDCGTFSLKRLLMPATVRAVRPTKWLISRQADCERAAGEVRVGAHPGTPGTRPPSHPWQKRTKFENGGRRNR